ncbi:MAG: hypothetical protein KUG71_06220 [Porticoccaceae bacterium]|nr:hypothetical protein [Porticoccaceae bacterium]
MSFKRLIRTATLIGSLMLLAACAPIRQTGSVPVYTSSPSVTSNSDTSNSDTTAGLELEDPTRPTEPEYEIAPSTPAEKPAQKAVQSLLDEAWMHYRNDDPDRAIAMAERAQRLDARSGEVYLVLASSYLIQGKQQLAEQFARRGISYSAVGTTLRNRLQQLLGQATAL